MLLSLSRPDSGINLTADTNLGKSPKGDRLLRLIIPDGFHQPDHPFLYKIIALTANKIKLTRLLFHHTLISIQKIINPRLLTLLDALADLFIGHLIKPVFHIYLLFSVSHDSPQPLTDNLISQNTGGHRGVQ